MKFKLINIISIIFLIILVPGCRKKNHPPYTPYTPIGPVKGVTNISYEFSSKAIDLDDDNVAIRFDWGNGDTSNWSNWVDNEDAIKISFFWQYTDTYYIKAQAKDNNEALSEWSLPHSIIIKPNQPPDMPATPSGPLNGYTKTCYKFLSSAVDPDGDSVSIRFDWGNGNISDWCSWIESGDSIMIFTWWSSPDTYYIKAQAKDRYGSVSNWSLPFSIVITNREIRGIVWICGTDSAGWLPRESHASVVFDNNIWVTGGHYRSDEVWSSPDGVNWTCKTYSAGFGDRDDHTMVVFDGKIWVIGGGEAHHNPKNDVWCSSDGVNWICVTDSAQWSPRYHHSSVVFDNKLWVLGGTTGEEFLNDVWYSTDGMNWVCATNSARWSAREDHTSVVFDNKIWVMSGTTSNGYENDVYYSADGRDWSRATSSAEWPERMASTSVVYDNKMWILGGLTGGHGLIGLNDVWYSTNGYSWICDCPLIKFPPRWDHTAVVFDDRIWVLGGAPPGWEGLNDVWYRTIIEKK